MTPKDGVSQRRALVVEDQTTLRDLLVELLQATDWAAEGCATAGAARLLLTRQHFDLLLLDLVLPDAHGLDVLTVLRGAADAQHVPRVVVLTAHARPALIREAVTRGAHGVVTKGAPLSELRAAIERVSAGGVYYSTETSTLLRAAVARPERDEQLTDRQREILRCVALGRSTREIAEQLGLSEKTVSNHRARIMERLGVHEVAGLTRHAITLGLIDPGP
jgi:DNA-binding NarL/FixJ family response regulator